MTDEYYSALPEGVGAAALAPLVLKCVGDSAHEATDVTVAKLNELGDRQWHTYEPPSDAVRSAVQEWVRHQFDTGSRQFLEDFLAIGYTFSFEKDIFRHLLIAYTGEHRSKFEEDLRRSSGLFIDPWWSLRRTPKPSPETTPGRGSA